MKELQANELRIGNHLYNDGVIVKIDARSIFDIWNNEGLKKYKPIPLTEELLLRCGFELTNTKKKQYFKWVNRGRKLRVLRGIKRVGYRFFATSEGFYFDCQYLHQLQNLYWILCGDELNIK